MTSDSRTPSPHRPDPATYYTVTHPESQTADWRAFYEEADRLTAVTRAGLEHRLDIPYGRDPKQFLDVYFPAAGQRRKATFVFVHGGGFREGDRAHYGFVARALAEDGVATVVPSYRLLPGSGYFDAVDDVRAAIEWVARENASDSPDEPVVVGGHSAGAVLAAFVAGNRAWLRERSLREDLLLGLAAISAAYDFTSNNLSSYVRERFASDDERRAASPLFNLQDPSRRALVAVGANERGYVEPSRAFAEKLSLAHVATAFRVLAGIGHDGTVLSLADRLSELSAGVRTLFGE